MANELINPVAIGHETLMRLENNYVFVKQVTREFDQEFAVAGAKIGHIFNARLPVRRRGRRGDAFQPHAIRETTVPIAVNELWGDDMDVTDRDLTLTVDRFAERYVEASASAIANLMDGDLADQYKFFYNHVGTPGTAITTLATYAQAGVALSNSAVPKDKSRAMVVSADMEAQVLGFGANLFNPVGEISRQYTEGTMGVAVGFKWSMDQNVAAHTVGGLGTAQPQVDGPNQTGTAILTKSWSAGATLNEGDIVSFEGSNAVNPASFRDVGKLRTFRVTQLCTASGAGAMTIYIDPPLDPVSGDNPFQTVTASPADSANVRVFGALLAGFAAIKSISAPQALAIHKEAIALVVVKQELPGGTEWAEWVSNPRIGIGLRLTRDWDPRGNNKLTRVEVLGGVKTVRQEMGCRVSAA